MSIYHELYEAHKVLLSDRGFDEQTLSSPNRDGFLFDTLRVQLDQCIREMTLGETKTGFSLLTVGFFNNDKDMVNYRLDYNFDADTLSLDISKLEIRWQGKSKVIKLGANEDLPYASVAFEEFKKEVLAKQAQASDRRSRKRMGPTDNR
ncbi:hypothetical protein [Chitinophaga tropicalis]|uniref:Uncharacterized protein n=1 Tax=Chitinophaga tropicalis TaxID=2683588 RepID=A0A7K1U041_9BACT|nr:hypothetical protein [Chitinophaga tropicalis]MVT07737.1 hypothetical protein [Chitinophaga tropicalis]